MKKWYLTIPIASMLLLSSCGDSNTVENELEDQVASAEVEKEEDIEEPEAFEEVMKNLTADSGVPSRFFRTPEGELIQKEIDRLSAERNKSIHPHGRWSSSPQNIHLADKEDVISVPAKQAPIIGMTDYEVVESTWGNPSKINKTETINGIREQWVYSNGYLYFEDHYLVSIQSSR